jgi:hypothetical protein
VKNLVVVLKILDRGQIGQAIKSDGGEVFHFNHESKGEREEEYLKWVRE